MNQGSRSHRSILTILGSVVLPMILACVIWAPAHANEQLQKITLQLRSSHQFQFAGYYAAQEKGFYRNEGFDVSFVTRQPGMSVTEEVIEGRADFGVGNPELLLDYYEGAPVVVLAAIFQHSPEVLLSKTETAISTPRHLRDKRVMINGSASPSIMAMLKSQDVELTDMTVLDISRNVKRLIQGSTDAMVAYQTDQPYAMRLAGIPVNIMRPLSYGIDFYGDCLFTSLGLAESDPSLVERFTRASLKGWDYAMDHPDELVGIIYSKYVTTRPWSALTFEAEAMRELILPKLVEIGSMNRKRWDHIAQTYHNLGMSSQVRPLEDFIYIPLKQRELEWLKKWSPSLLPLITIIIMATLVLLLFNRRLKRGISKRTQELESSRQSLRQVIDLVPDMVYVKNREGIFLLANRAAADYHGSTVEELTGRNLKDIHDPEEAMRMLADDLEVLDTGFPKVILEEPFHHRDGSIRWLQTTKLPYTSLHTDESAVLSLSVDITNRKLAEEALKNSEERFRAIFNQTYQFTGIVDIDGTLVQVNDSALVPFNITREDVVGKPYWESSWWAQNKETHEWLKDVIRRAGQGETVRKETTHKLPDGGVLNIDFSIKPARDENGTILFLIPEGRDITSLKTTEDELRKLNEELEHRVSERTQNLQEAKQELEHSLEQLHKMQQELVLSEKMAALGGLVAGVAHEINTPLGIGVTASSFLHENMIQLAEKFKDNSLKKSDLEKFISTGKESTESILTNLNRAAELIRSFKQVAADQSSEIPRHFNLKSYVDEVLLSLRPKYKRTDHTIENNCPDKEIFSYPGAFMQIITNLLVNSLTHAFEGKTAGYIRIGGEIQDDILTFTFSDDGSGIPTEFMDKVFEPFYTTKRGEGGTGLGLHIVFNTVTQTLGGTIRFTSAQGKGTNFTITLPVTQNKQHNPGGTI